MKRPPIGNPTISEKLGEFVYELSYSALGEEDRRKVKALILYGASVGVASGQATLAKKVAEMACRHQGDLYATCLLNGVKCTPEEAAFANAVLFHVRMQEDAHPAGHVGVAIIPAAMAVAESLRLGGDDLLSAVYSGYEVALRIGRDHAASMSKRGFRTTPIYGAIGGAAAAGKAMGLTAAELSHAIGIAANMASGLRIFQVAGSEEYALHAGFAAKNAILAARLAQQKIEAAPQTFEGRAGFFAAFGENSEGLVPRVTAELGMDYETRKVTYKPQPGGQFHRGIIRGAVALSKQHSGRTIKEIRVHLSPFVAEFPGIAFYGPFTSYPSAFYSVPFSAALAWIDQCATFRGFHRFSDIQLQALINKVHLVKDDSRNNYDPRILAVFDDGEIAVWEEVLGEEGYTLKWDVAKEMTHLLFEETHLSASEAEKLIEMVHSLDAAKVSQLMHITTHAAKHAASSFSD